MPYCMHGDAKNFSFVPVFYLSEFYLFDSFQILWVNSCYEVGLSRGIKIFTHRIHINQGIVRNLHAFEVWKKPGK